MINGDIIIILLSMFLGIAIPACYILEYIFKYKNGDTCKFDIMAVFWCGVVGLVPFLNVLACAIMLLFVFCAFWDWMDAEAKLNTLNSLIADQIHKVIGKREE